MISSRARWLHASAAIAFLVTIHVAQAQSPAATRARLTVTPKWLAAHLRDSNLVLLHVAMMDDERSDYDKGHIAGARFMLMDDLSAPAGDPDTGLNLEMPTADTLRAQLARLGISDRSRIVVYNASSDASHGTRVMFTLDYAGLGDRSVLLDGGLAGWKAAGLPLTTAVPTPTVGTLSALHVRPIVVDAAFVRSHVNTPGYRVLDGRAAVFYDGVRSTAKRQGHIAGAKSLPFNEVTDDTGHLKSAPALTALFARAGVSQRDTVIAYCHIGQQATAVLFAARTLGHPVLLYDGSFQDWGRRADFPVEAH
jgi:thiosulfate/3-mercaptopyruvate sulfurtransferase